MYQERIKNVMFHCGLCGQLSALGEPATRVVTETAPITHPETGKVSWRIVKEVLAHEICALARGVKKVSMLELIKQIRYIPPRVEKEERRRR